MKSLLLYCFLMLITFSCTLQIDCEKECKEESSDCVEYFLDKYDMEGYNGEALDCRNFLEYWIYQGDDYHLIGNHCADIAPIPFDCEGYRLKNELEQLFFMEAEFIRIIAYNP